MKKYVRYHLVADSGNVSEHFESYREAYSSYCKEVHYGHPATLYGYDSQDNVSVIFSKG